MSKMTPYEAVSAIQNCDSFEEEQEALKAIESGVQEFLLKISKAEKEARQYARNEGRKYDQPLQGWQRMKFFLLEHKEDEFYSSFSVAPNGDKFEDCDGMAYDFVLYDNGKKVPMNRDKAQCWLRELINGNIIKPSRVWNHPGCVSGARCPRCGSKFVSHVPIMYHDYHGGPYLGCDLCGFCDFDNPESYFRGVMPTIEIEDEEADESSWVGAIKLKLKAEIAEATDGQED